MMLSPAVRALLMELSPSIRRDQFSGELFQCVTLGLTQIVSFILGKDRQ
jgi:hypothetical protein